MEKHHNQALLAIGASAPQPKRHRWEMIMRSISTIIVMVLALMVLQACVTNSITGDQPTSPAEIALMEKWNARPQLSPTDFASLRRDLDDMQEQVALTNGFEAYSTAYRIIFSPNYGNQTICVRINKRRFLTTLTVKVTIPTNMTGHPKQLVYSSQSLLDERDMTEFENLVVGLTRSPPEPSTGTLFLDPYVCIVEMVDIGGHYWVTKRTQPGARQGQELKHLAGEIRQKENPAFDPEYELEIQKHFAGVIKWCADRTGLEVLKIYARP
jgi:hypothetical protein